MGLDNIGVFDRSTLEGLPPGVRLEQADATAWMAMYCADMLSISLELAQANPSYEDIASKVRLHALTGSWATRVPWTRACGRNRVRARACFL